MGHRLNNQVRVTASIANTVLKKIWHQESATFQAKDRLHAAPTNLKQGG